MEERARKQIFDALCRAAVNLALAATLLEEQRDTSCERELSDLSGAIGAVLVSYAPHNRSEPAVSA